MLHFVFVVIFSSQELENKHVVNHLLNIGLQIGKKGNLLRVYVGCSNSVHNNAWRSCEDLMK